MEKYKKKFEETTIENLKKELIKSLQQKKSHLVREIGKDEISIATGDKYSVVVKIIGIR